MPPLRAWQLAGGAPAWSPRNLASLYAWHRGDSVTKVAGDVDVFADKSGNGRELVAAAPADRPLFVASGINGKPVARFDGAANKMQWTGVDMVTDLAAGAEIFVVSVSDADPPPTNTESGWWDLGSSGQVSHHPLSGTGVIYDAFGSNVRKTVGNPAAPLTAANAYNVVSVAGEWTARLDGVNIFTTGTNTVGWEVLGRFGVGAAIAWFDGDAAEIIICSGKLSMADRIRVHRYLNTRYGLALPTEVPLILGGDYWWDTREPGTVDLNGGDVSALRCRITGSEFAQGTALKQPLLVASDSDYNGTPSMSFDSAASQSLTWAHAAALDFLSDGSGGEVFVVGEAPVANQAIFTNGMSTSNTAKGALLWTVGAADLRMLVGNASGTGFTVNSANAVAGLADTPSAIGAYYSTAAGAGSEWNGDAANTPETNAPASGTTYDASIGVRGGPGNYFNGKVAQVLMFKRVLSAADRAEVFTYLRDTFGVV